MIAIIVSSTAFPNLLHFPTSAYVVSLPNTSSVATVCICFLLFFSLSFSSCHNLTRPPVSSSPSDLCVPVNHSTLSLSCRESASPSRHENKSINILLSRCSVFIHRKKKHRGTMDTIWMPSWQLSPPERRENRLEAVGWVGGGWKMDYFARAVKSSFLFRFLSLIIAFTHTFPPTLAMAIQWNILILTHLTSFFFVFSTSFPNLDRYLLLLSAPFLHSIEF